MATRFAKRARRTKETQIAVEVAIDGDGVSQIGTGVPFFDHMLTQLSKHGAFDINIDAEGDLAVDTHHTVEDTGILLGEVFREALSDKRGVRRFASIAVPLDEARIEVTVDLSGRPFFYYDVELPFGAPIGSPAFDAQLAEEFWRAFATAAGITLHIRMITGKNIHHIVEATFKGVARALRDAVRIEGTGIPSTKGTLDANESGDEPQDAQALVPEPDSPRVSLYRPGEIRVVALDFNGTLVGDVDSYVSINVELARELGLKSLTGERFRSLAGTPGHDWTYAFRTIATEEGNELVLGMPKNPKVGLVTPDQSMEGNYQHVYEMRMKEQWARWERNVDHVLAPGAASIVSRLRNAGIRVVVISTQYNEQIEPVLDLCGLLDVIGTSNIHGGVESKADAMREVAASEGVMLGQMLYVGDERKDFVHAAEVGAQFAHIPSGVNSQASLIADAKRLRRPMHKLNGVFEIADAVENANARLSSTEVVDLNARDTAVPESRIAS